MKGKKLMVDDYIVDKVLDKTKMIIDVKKVDDTKIFIETDDKFPDDITLKYAMILTKCDIKNGNKFYPKIFLKEALNRIKD